MFLNTKLPIGDEIDRCSIDELKAVVGQFATAKDQ
jgi:hypothetical protein